MEQRRPLRRHHKTCAHEACLACRLCDLRDEGNLSAKLATRIRIGVQIHVNASSAHLVDKSRERLVRESAREVGCGDELLSNTPVLRTGQRWWIDKKRHDTAICAARARMKVAEANV